MMRKTHTKEKKCGIKMSDKKSSLSHKAILLHLLVISQIHNVNNVFGGTVTFEFFEKTHFQIFFDGLFHNFRQKYSQSS